MNRKILIPLWLIVALVACGGVRPVTTLQVIHSSLATAQDIEASLCWGAANVRLVPADQDRTHCTSPTASLVKLTDVRHQTINRGLSSAFTLEIAAGQIIKAGGTPDLTLLRSTLASVLAEIAGLNLDATVAQLKAAVEAAKEAR